jgi:hypothetical protein
MGYTDNFSSAFVYAWPCLGTAFMWSTFTIPLLNLNTMLLTNASHPPSIYKKFWTLDTPLGLQLTFLTLLANPSYLFYKFQLSLSRNWSCMFCVLYCGPNKNTFSLMFCCHISFILLLIRTHRREIIHIEKYPGFFAPPSIYTSPTTGSNLYTLITLRLIIQMIVSFVIDFCSQETYVLLRNTVRIVPKGI